MGACVVGLAGRLPVVTGIGFVVGRTCAVGGIGGVDCVGARALCGAEVRAVGGVVGVVGPVLVVELLVGETVVDCVGPVVDFVGEIIVDVMVELEGETVVDWAGLVVDVVGVLVVGKIVGEIEARDGET